MNDEQERCAAKIGEPYHMSECGKPVEYVNAGDTCTSGAIAVNSGWHHVEPIADHGAVPRSWVR